MKSEVSAHLTVKIRFGFLIRFAEVAEILSAKFLSAVLAVSGVNYVSAKISFFYEMSIAFVVWYP